MMHLSIAVDLDYEGLLAPVVRDAETKRLAAIATEISDLADRARTRKLSPDEISGGTFTLTNNGSAGSVLTMPIINQPLGAIMPLAEAQSAWVADLISGDGGLPDRAAMARDVALTQSEMERRYVASTRHTIQVDFENYLREISRERRRSRGRVPLAA